jgi:hypothetical protein
MSVSLVGSYVSYKDLPFIVTEERGSLLLLLSPTEGKVQVSRAKTLPTKYKPALLAAFKGATYLVTATGLIISLTTSKVMQWSDTNPIRLGILANAAL